jgi:hypothetical protein
VFGEDQLLSGVFDAVRLHFDRSRKGWYIQDGTTIKEEHTVQAEYNL